MTEINLSIHPHTLILAEEMKNDQEILCPWCLDPVNDDYYNCKECSFSVHDYCADSILRKWHSHDLIEDDECYCCRRCGEIFSSSLIDVSLFCKTFILGSGATNLPREIKHVFHRKHSLFLVPNKSPINRDGYSLDYYCSCCEFTLDIKTALQRPLCLQESENHKHQFVPFVRSEHAFHCDACGLKFETFGTSKGSFLCTICQIIVHDDCTALTQTINIFHHNHPLTHTFFFLLKEEDMPPADKINCRLCHYKVDMDFGGYYCAGCHFAAHVSCANLNRISTNNPYVHGQDAIIDLLEEIELKEDELPVEIKHFSHEHKLIRSDEVEDKCCDGCIRPISLPFYRCVECDFFLHKACINLPHKIRRAFHEHPLTLIPSSPDNMNATFKCTMCSEYCHGFVYSCEDQYCSFNVDVRCASIPLNFRHPGHDQKLSFTCTNSDDTCCDSCSAVIFKYYFKCNECPFGIDYRCATLPSIARNGDHHHPFVLTYHTVDDDDSDAYYCDLCEKERDPKHWYYYCAQAECDYVAHPSCALGKYPYLLSGRSYNISRSFFTLHGSNFEHRINLCSECDSLPLIPKIFSDHKLHEHPLVFSSSGYKDCDTCQREVDGIWFRCEECDFDAHFECVLGDDFKVPCREISLNFIRRSNLDKTCLPCMVCDEDCIDVCLKCPKVECSFCVHYNCALSLRSM